MLGHEARTEYLVWRSAHWPVDENAVWVIGAQRDPEASG